MSATDERPTKVCPDCAETVLRAARKCRFCGYRFDGEPAEPNGEGRGLLGPLLRPRAGPSTVPAMLARWGVELGDEELVSDFNMAEVDGAVGFVVVTSSRFLFFEQHARGCALARELALSDVDSVETVRVRGRRKLRVGWERSEMVVGGIPRRALVELGERLLPRADRSG